MKFPLHGWRGAAIAALAVALAAPGSTSAQRRDRDRDQRDLELRLRETERSLANAFRQVHLHLNRARLGVSIEDDDGGVRIVEVLEDGPAEKAGLEDGDVIVALDGVALSSPIEDEDEDDDWGPSERLIHLLADVEPGDVVRVEYTRDGSRASVDVETTERNAFAFYGTPVPLTRWRSGGPAGVFRLRGFGAGFMGADLADINEGLGTYFGVESGALVLDVNDEDNDLGLRPGDVIVEIGGRDVADASDAYRILGSYERGERLRLVVVRERNRVTLEGSVD